MAFQVCAAVTCSWEEEQEERGTAEGDHCTTCPNGALEYRRGSGPGLASALHVAVFDTLADACFVSLSDGDKDTLAAALAAVWAADGALRRVRVRGRTAVNMTVNIRPASTPDGEGEGGAGALPSTHEDPASGETRPSGYGTSGEWAEESRMVGIVRSLAQRCPGLSGDTGTRAEPAIVAGDDGDGEGDDDAGGYASGDRGGSSIGGVRASMTSEDPGGGAAWPVGALSLVELAGAVLDAVGPEATGEVLAACPQLLESMPPKVCARNRKTG